VAPTSDDRLWGAETASDPLVQREVCRSGGLDELRTQLGNFFYTAKVETLTRGADLRSSRLSAVRLNHITLGFLRFGSETEVDAGALGSYHVNLALSGRVASECGARQAVATTRRAAVFTPREHSVLPRWSADASQVCIKIDKAALEAELAALLGRPTAGDVRFELPLDLTTAPAASWLATVRLLIEEVDRPDGLLARSVHHRDHLEKLLIAGLLHTQNHDYLDELLSPRAPARPRTVKRVLDLIEAHPETNYSLSDLARHAGVGARRLQLAFHETLNTSPAGYLRKVKLEHARADLLTGDLTVTAVAHRWGFHHPGRFAAIYRRAFGESPSDTRRRGPSA
jgi:AraC-like DNA-binding protein